MSRVHSAQLRKATAWLFAAAVKDHIMRCESARFPDEHPTCMEKCCPNCCGTCNTLRWFRDSADNYARRFLNDFTGAPSSWQMADGSVDWSQIEAHWDDRGATCGRTKCFQETAMMLGMGLLTVQELGELGAV